MPALTILLIGLSGIVAQILLLRELLVSFCGNELTIGIILANWIILEAAGAFILGRFIYRCKNKLNVFIALQILFSLALPVAIYFARTLKAFAGIPFGEAVGLPIIFLASLIIVLPAAFCHGAIFSLLCVVNVSIGKVYAWETIGAIVGGVALTYILFPFFNSFQIIFCISLANIAICLPFLLVSLRAKRSNHAFKIASSLSLLAMTLVSIFVLKGGAGFLQRSSISNQFSSNKVLDYKNSLYGNIAVVKRLQQYTFYYNGLPIIISPYPDISFTEDFGNLALLFHDSPKDVLCLSGCAGGLIQEALKHPIDSLDYAELDPELINLLKNHPTSLIEKELNDKRVNVVNSDARFFLKQSSKFYDVILIGLSNPADLSTNRLFTKEFFQLAKSKLRSGGILSFWLGGSLTYLSPQLRDLNVSILNAAKEVFGYSRVIPGDYNIFLVSEYVGVIRVSADEVSRRLAQRNIQSSILVPKYINYRLDEKRIDWFREATAKAPAMVNRDLRPIAVYQMLKLWNKKFSPGFNGMLAAGQSLNLLSIFILVLLLTFILACLNWRKTNRSLAIAYAVATTGFFSMLSNLMLIFVYQVFYGNLYYRIGLLTSIFMAGIALGSILISAKPDKLKKDFNLFIIFELLIIIFIFLMALGINVFFNSGHYLFYAFILLFFSSGLLTGLEFPLANKLCLGGENKLARTVGTLYAVDLLGGWLAGILGGVILLPVLGFSGSCMVMLMFKASSLLVLAITRIRQDK